MQQRINLEQGLPVSQRAHVHYTDIKDNKLPATSIHFFAAGAAKTVTKDSCGGLPRDTPMKGETGYHECLMMKLIGLFEGRSRSEQAATIAEICLGEARDTLANWRQSMMNV